MNLAELFDDLTAANAERFFKESSVFDELGSASGPEVYLVAAHKLRVRLSPIAEDVLASQQWLRDRGFSADIFGGHR